jgi:hypothetical protein
MSIYLAPVGTDVRATLVHPDVKSASTAVVLQIPCRSLRVGSSRWAAVRLHTLPVDQRVVFVQVHDGAMPCAPYDVDCGAAVTQMMARYLYFSTGLQRDEP